jgi:RimJ/RimL family protein N-acetyltransferase
MDIETERLLLTPISPERARQIVAGDRMGDRWHPEYPLVDELDPLRGLAATQDPDPVFTMYVIRQRHDTLAIGGLGFFGPPDDLGRIEFGYGLVPSVRGRGYATEAVIRALEVAAEHGALSAAADTALANLSSQRVLEKAGLAEARRDAGTIFYARPLTSRHA